MSVESSLRGQLSPVELSEDSSYILANTY